LVGKFFLRYSDDPRASPFTWEGSHVQSLSPSTRKVSENQSPIWFLQPRRRC
jgi:hypothetical protein